MSASRHITMRETPYVPPTPPAVKADALAFLARHDALDLAAMLGLNSQEVAA